MKEQAAAAVTSSVGDLKGKVAVVTGASKGIGAAIAKSLSKAGEAVVVNYASSKGTADRVVADIKASGGKAAAVKGDVARAADVQRLFDQTQNNLRHARRVGERCRLLQVSSVGSDHLGRVPSREFDINAPGTPLAIKQALKQFGPNGAPASST